MRNILSFFKETDASPEFYSRWVSNAQTMHGAVFAYVESLVVLAALDFATTKAPSPGLWAVYIFAYVAQLALTGTYFRAGSLLLLSKTSLAGSRRDQALWVIGFLGLAFNVWIVGALSTVVSQLVAAGFSP